MTGDRTTNQEAQCDCWENVATDPHLERDLGYRIEEWETVSARAAKGDRLLFLPTDEARLREEAFVVVDTDVVCDVIDHV
jgi:hypothetical protein